MICALDDIENKHDVYGGKDFMKKFYESSNKPAMKIVNFEKKGNWYYQQTKSSSNLAKKSLNTNMLMVKNIIKLVIIIQVNAEVLAKELKGQFQCLGKITGIFFSFWVPVKK